MKFSIEGGEGRKTHDLFHYTNADGLIGILTSKVMWATHSGYLNDKRERSAFFDERLPHHLRVFGEHLPDEAIHEYASDLKALALKDTPMFVASLCSPAHESDARHGLLSQWRGYGERGGGYAVVFDAERLKARIKNEGQVYAYYLSLIAPVEYFDTSGGGDAKSEASRALEKALIGTGMLGAAVTADTEKMAAMYAQLNVLSCLYKNDGFREEAEYRIALSPSLNHSEEDYEDLPRKEIKYRNKGGLLIPYLEISLTLDDGTLPIKRIIVGPGHDMERRKSALEFLIAERELNIEVVDSGIPFVS